jgi:aminopeptidase
VPDFALIAPASRVVTEILAVEPIDRLLIAHDAANEEVARAFEFAGNERKARVDRVDWETLAPRPWTSCPSILLAALREATATILAVSNEDGEYGARFAFLQAATRARHVHMIGTSRRAFLNVLSASLARIFEINQRLRESMRPTSRLSVRSAAGTSCEIETAPHLRWVANGGALRPGQWLNVPFGALVTSPASVSGIYVADAAMGGTYGGRIGSLATRPLRLVIEGGRVRSVECRDSALRSHVERFIAEGQGHERVGLVSLGTNVGLLNPIGELSHDENVPGLHVALGDNLGARTGATWTAHGQLAFAIAQCDVELDGVPLIRNGRYVRLV